MTLATAPTSTVAAEAVEVYRVFVNGEAVGEVDRVPGMNEARWFGREMVERDWCAENGRDRQEVYARYVCTRSQAGW